MYNNHKNLVYKVLENFELREDDFEIEVEDEDDVDEQVQNLLVDSFNRDKDIICIRLGNVSQDSNGELDNSFDYLELESPRVPPVNPD